MGDNHAAYRLDTAAADAETAACVRLCAEIEYAREDLRLAVLESCLPSLRGLVDAVQGVANHRGAAEQAGLLLQAVDCLDSAVRLSLRSNQEQQSLLRCLESTQSLLGEFEMEPKLCENRPFREACVESEASLHDAFEAVSFWRGMERSYCRPVAQPTPLPNACPLLPHRSALMRTKATQMVERAQIIATTCAREIQASLPPEMMPAGTGMMRMAKDNAIGMMQMAKEGQAGGEGGKEGVVPLWQCVERSQASLSMAASGMLVPPPLDD